MVELQENFAHPCSSWLFVVRSSNPEYRNAEVCVCQQEFKHLIRFGLPFKLQDKMEVGKNGQAMFELDPNGLPQVFYYGNIREPASFAAHKQVGLK